MAKKSMEFTDFKKDCRFKTYQDNKCVNEKNKLFRLVESCQEALCPIFKDPEAGVSSEVKEIETTKPEVPEKSS